MLENETELRRVTDQVVANMIAVNLAEKKFYTDERVGKEYWNLVTPGAFDKELIAIAALGYAEQVGVWSHEALGEVMKFYEERTR